MRIAIALLLVLNMGMAGLYYFVLRLDTSTEIILSRRSLTAQWVDENGLVQTFTTPPRADETLDEQEARHKEGCVKAMQYFPPCKEPRR